MSDLEILQQHLRIIVTKINTILCNTQTDTHMGNTDLTFTGPRAYEGAGAAVTYNNLGSLDVNTVGAGGVQLTNDTGAGDYTSVELANGRVDLVASSFGSTLGTLSITPTDTTWGQAAGVYYLGDGFNTLPPPTYADDAAAGAGGLTAGRLYKTATGVLMIKL